MWRPINLRQTSNCSTMRSICLRKRKNSLARFLMTKTDIQNEEDIKRLVHTFYEKVNRDEILSPIFNDVVKVNWEEHLPLLCRFWSTLLFRTMTFEGRPFPKHL